MCMHKLASHPSPPHTHLEKGEKVFGLGVVALGLVVNRLDDKGQTRSCPASTTTMRLETQER